MTSYSPKWVNAPWWDDVHMQRVFDRWSKGKGKGKSAENKNNRDNLKGKGKSAKHKNGREERGQGHGRQEERGEEKGEPTERSNGKSKGAYIRRQYKNEYIPNPIFKKRAFD